MIYLRLFYEFAKIGLFAIGGGMATIPFLQRLSATTGWFDADFITEMIAISESTPGPIGINMATYVGYEVAGLAGSIIASLALALPSVLIATLVAKSIQKYADNKYVKSAFYGIRPAVIAMIVNAAFIVINTSMIHYSKDPAVSFSPDILKIALFGAFLAAILLTKKKKWAHPIVFIAIGAVLGIVLEL